MLRKSHPAAGQEAARRRLWTALEATAEYPLPATARAAGWSIRELHRRARALLGQGPAAQRRRDRLNRAALELLAGRASVLQIALSSGFQSHEAFTRAFRRRFGLAPSAFRRRPLAARPPGLRLGFALAAHVESSSSLPNRQLPS